MNMFRTRYFCSVRVACQGRNTRIAAIVLFGLDALSAIRQTPAMTTPTLERCMFGGQ